MANVNIELTHDSNAFNPDLHEKLKQLYSEFEKKWEDIIILFEGKFLNNGYIIADPSGINVSSSSFPTLDDGKPNYDRAVCRFLENIVEWDGEEFGTGQKGFPNDFYKDLYIILTYYEVIRDNKLEINAKFTDSHKAEVDKMVSEEEEVVFFCFNTTVDGQDRYYSGNYALKPNGLKVISEFYEEDEDEDIW
jgi:hypothetical protein